MALKLIHVLLVLLSVFANVQGSIPSSSLTAWQTIFDEMGGSAWRGCYLKRADPCTCNFADARVTCSGNVMTILELMDNKLANAVSVDAINTLLDAGLLTLDFSTTVTASTPDRFNDITYPASETCLDLPKCLDEAVTCDLSGTGLEICTPSPNTSPTLTPTSSPTTSPTVSPTTSRTVSPTTSPTTSPTVSPTTSPTTSPTVTPTTSPTVTPTTSPTVTPITSPTVTPTTSPTASPKLTSEPPTLSPTQSPSSAPSESPTKHTSVSPTSSPILFQTGVPIPGNKPTLSPTTHPPELTLSPTRSPITANQTTTNPNKSSTPSPSHSNDTTSTGSNKSQPSFLQAARPSASEPQPTIAPTTFESHVESTLLAAYTELFPQVASKWNIASTLCLVVVGVSFLVSVYHGFKHNRAKDIFKSTSVMFFLFLAATATHFGWDIHLRNSDMSLHQDSTFLGCGIGAKISSVSKSFSITLTYWISLQHSKRHSKNPKWVSGTVLLLSIAHTILEFVSASGNVIANICTVAAHPTFASIAAVVQTIGISLVAKRALEVHMRSKRIFVNKESLPEKEYLEVPNTLSGHQQGNCKVVPASDVNATELNDASRWKDRELKQSQLLHIIAFCILHVIHDIVSVLASTHTGTTLQYDWDIIAKFTNHYVLTLKTIIIHKLVFLQEDRVQDIKRITRFEPTLLTRFEAPQGLDFAQPIDAIHHL